MYTIFATIGEVAILKMDAATNQAIVGIQLKENKKMVFQGIMHTAIYRVLWKEKLVILDFVKSKVKKKITRSKSLSQ